MNFQKQFLVNLLIVSSVFSGLYGARTDGSMKKTAQNKKIVTSSQEGINFPRELWCVILELYVSNRSPKSPGELCKIVAILKLVCKDFDTFCQNNYPLNMVSNNKKEIFERETIFNKFNLSRHSKDSKGRTLLHIAAMKNKPDLCKSLLQSGGYCWKIEDNLRAKPWDYAVGNDTAKVFLDYKYNASESTRRIYPTCPAAVALIAGKIDTYRAITAGENRNERLSQGKFTTYGEKIVLILRTIKDEKNLEEFLKGKFKAQYDHFDAVIEANNIEALNFLLKKNKNYYLRSLEQDLSKHLKCACKNGYFDLVNILINDYDAQPTSEDVMIAGERGFWAIVKLLLDRGVGIHQVNTQRKTLLLGASLVGDHEAVKLILKNGGRANVNKANKYLETPLLAASFYGHTQVLKELLDNGAQIDLVGPMGDSALHKASQQGHTDIVTLLLKCGADRFKLNRKQQTPLVGALSYNHKAIIRALLKDGTEDFGDKDGATALHWASKQGNILLMASLLKNGANIDQATKEQGKTSLMVAVVYGHQAATKLLLDKGATVDLADKNGLTALHKAAWKGNIEGVKLLLKNGADQMKVDKFECIPLILASKGGFVETVRVLLSAAGSDVNLIKSNYGSFAFLHAVFSGCTNVIKELIANGVDINCKYKSAPCTLYIAMLKGHVSIVRLLLDHGARIDNDMFDWDDAINSLLGFTKFSWRKISQRREQMIPLFNDETKEKYRKIYGLLMAKKAELESK